MLRSEGEREGKREEQQSKLSLRGRRREGDKVIERSKGGREGKREMREEGRQNGEEKID